MLHLEEEVTAQYVAGLLLGDARNAADAHLASCEVCRSRVAAYERIVAAVASPLVPQEAVARLQELIRQRVRLTQFVQRLVSDPAWRVEVQRDPHVALERHQIRPTPQLVAALKDLTSLDERADGSQLDARISKLLPPI